LRFPHDHGVEARRYAKQVMDGIPLPVLVQVGLQVGGGDAKVVVGESAQISTIVRGFRDYLLR
jgi:hypothetical protein